MSKVLFDGNKRVSRRTLLKGAGLAAGTLALGRIGGLGQTAFYNVGAVIPLTGDLKAFGPRFQVAAQIAIDEINAAGGAGGFLLNMTVRDEDNSGAVATASAQQLVAEGVQVIFGTAASGRLIASSSVTIPNNVVMISPSSTSLAVRNIPNNANGLIFRTTANDGLQAIVLAKLAQKRGYKKIAIIARNDAYGAGLQAGLKANFESLGGTVTATPLYDPETTTDFSAEIAAATAGNPDAISLITFNEGEALITQMVRAGVTTFDLFVDGNKDQDLITRLVGSIGAAPLAGKVGTAPATAETIGGQTFTQLIQAKLNEPPFVYTPNSYDALAVVGLAIANAARKNGGKAPTGLEIRDNMRLGSNPAGEVVTVGQLGPALQIIKNGGDVNYEGAGGSVDFAADGDVVGPVGTWYIDASGKIQELELVQCDATSCGAVTKDPPK